jgi:hypothetical protein
VSENGAVSTEPTVVDNPEQNRYEVRVNDELDDPPHHVPNAMK